MLDVFKDFKLNEKDWLICGKGPSLDSINNYDISSYSTIGLNHVCRDRHVTVAHIIDVDVIDQLGEKLLTNCDYLFMPYFPHMGFRPHGFLTLEALCRTHPVLSKMQDRVYGYDLSTAANMLNKKWGDGPLVWASFFSAEAVVNLLGKLGIKRIRTLGVDGGFNQAEQFKDLQNVNVNGYDAEWKGIRKSVTKYAIDYSPLGVESPIRIFIGAGVQQLIPALVLRHSILKHATMSVDVTIMNDWTHPMPKDSRNCPRTPFSFQRFMIPEKCGYQGHAIYMDSDMLVFSDVKDIWTCDLLGADYRPMRGEDVDKHKAQWSVFKIDCGTSRWDINNIIENLDTNFRTYEDLVFNCNTGCGEYSGIAYDENWNSLEEYVEGKTKLLHYTEMYSQPWLVNPNHPLGYLWFNELKELIKEEPSVLNMLEEHIKKGWLRKECLELISCGSTQP